LKSIAEKTGINNLKNFCRHFLSKFAIDDFHDTEMLAAEFRRYFGIDDNLRLADLENIALERLGISEFSPYTALSNDRAWYCIFRRKAPPDSDGRRRLFRGKAPVKISCQWPVRSGTRDSL
jgi:hypothetical protein